jgi:stress response protein YsnF
MKTVVGVFTDANEARQSFNELVRSGFGQADISVVTPLDMQGALNLDFRPMDTADIGRVAARGPFADAITSTQRGLGRLLRAHGFSPELADHYARAVRQGETLESLVVDDTDADRAVSIMTRHAARFGEPESMGAMGGAEKLESKTTNGNPTPGTIATIPILREELRVGKREVERAHVRVGVHVAERPIDEKVRLREEHVEIERIATNRAPRPEEMSFKNADLDIVEYGEEPVVEKDVRVVEEVIVKKTLGGREETIRDTARNTYIDVAEDRFDRSLYQKHFESLGSKGRFEEHLPAYELGHSLRGKGGRWEEIEQKAKTSWEAKRPGTWDSVKDSVKHAFSRK